MKPKIILTGVMALTIVLIAGSVWAQTGGGYNLTWSSIDGGAAVSTGGEYTLRGTVGQADVGNLSGGGYRLAGGFWGQPVVINIPPSEPNAAPIRNYFIVRQVTLTWNPLSGATAYQVQVALNSTFTNIVYTSPELSPSTLFLQTTWPNNATYYWRVHAKNNLGVWSPWSAYDTFTINAP